MTDFEISLEGCHDEIKQIQENVDESSEKNNKLKTQFDFAETKLDLLEQDFKKTTENVARNYEKLEKMSDSISRLSQLVYTLIIMPHNSRYMMGTA